MELEVLLLLKQFKENNVYIDNITIDKSKNDNYYYVTFWNNKKVVNYSYKMNYGDIYHYLKGISFAYSYSLKNNS